MEEKDESSLRIMRTKNIDDGLSGFTSSIISSCCNSIKTFRSIVVLASLVCCLLFAAAAATTEPANMYENTSETSNGGTWGKFCFAKSEYMPTCGWKVIVSMNYPFNSIQASETTAKKLDEYTYELTNEFYNPDLTARVNYCLNINIYGSFGNTNPEVSVTYSCVCDVTSDNVCKEVPHTKVTPFDPSGTTAVGEIPAAPVDPLISSQPAEADQTTSTAATSVTEKSTSVTDAGVVMTTITTPEAVGSGSEQKLNLDQLPQAVSSYPKSVISSNNNSNYTRIRLVKFENKCYTLTTSKTMMQFSVYHLTDCGTLCMGNEECHGINFYPQTNQCEMVTQEIAGVEFYGLGTVSGCQFWDVLSKS